MLTGYYEPTAGSIRIDGLDVEADPIGVQQRIGTLPEQTPLYPEMLVQEYLDRVADFRDLSPNRRASRNTRDGLGVRLGRALGSHGGD